MMLSVKPQNYFWNSEQSERQLVNRNWVDEWVWVKMNERSEWIERKTNEFTKWVNKWSDVVRWVRNNFGVAQKASFSILLKPERERSREKNQRTGDWTLQITDEKELALYLDPWEERLLNFVMSLIYMEFSNRFSRWRNITFIHIKNRQSLSTRSVWFPLFYGGSWKTSSWFLLYIGSAQLIRRRVKLISCEFAFHFDGIFQ